MEDAATLWDQCAPVTDDPEVAGWLSSSGIQPAAVTPVLARALPRHLPLPSWARYGLNPWNVDGYRLILPLYSPRGALDGLYARALRPILLPTNGTPRSFPVASGVSGCVMASDVALQILRTRRWPNGSSWRTIVIAGGAVDFLDWATAVREEGPAVLGIVPGSWTKAFANRIPDGCRIVVRAHRNPIAARYAHRVQEALARRCEVIVRTAS